MALLTIAALLVGVAVIGFVLLNQGLPGSTSTADVVAPHHGVPAGLSDGRTLGRAEAPVTIEIWSDFQCPACRTLTEDVEPRLIEEYVVPGTVKLVYRDAAFQGARVGAAYDESVESAAGARCAADQGRFWEMHNWIFANWDGENRGAFRAERLRMIAQSAGLDLAQYDACVATGTQQAQVRAETAAGTAAGIRSTPTLVVNGTPIVGVPPYAQLVAAIEQAAP